MADAVVACASFEELSEYVRQSLCEQDALDPNLTPFYRALVQRRGRPTGVVFHVEGPRMLRTSAVWAADDDRIVFYNSTGQRVRTVTLTEAPQVPSEVNPRRAA
jgi:hypothetical protein